MAIRVTFGDGFEQPEEDACSHFERLLPATATVRELREILATWAGFGTHGIDSFDLAAPFTSATPWQSTFGRCSRPLPTADGTMSLRELVEIMIADGGYAGVDSSSLAVFVQSPKCPVCGVKGSTFGRAAGCLAAYGGRGSFEDAGGNVIYQVGWQSWLTQLTSEFFHVLIDVRLHRRLQDLRSPGSEEIDYHEANLNKLSDDELARHKARMNSSFLANQMKPGDNGYVYDVRADFDAEQSCGWDSDEDEDDEE
ncbi:Centrosomal protein of 19 kDa (Cep19) [Durusdinium trenchii]|uniref:Centrosomal protein of 19 kDa n=1 Tax=Durusdinium trenchii TaxID=1381693 RepID=A0ABP0HUX3_9DINO